MKSKISDNYPKGNKSIMSYNNTNGNRQAQINDEKFKRIVDAALKSGKKFNSIIIENSEKMIQLAHNLVLEIESYQNENQNQEKMNDKQEIQSKQNENEDPTVTNSNIIQTAVSTMMPSNNKLEVAGEYDIENKKYNSLLTLSKIKPSTTSSSRTYQNSNKLLNTLMNGLETIQDSLQQLQFSSVQAEVDLIKDVKLPAMKPQKMVNGPKSEKKDRKKNSSFRLYTPTQQEKLEEWYQLSSRPEAAEINSMFRVINSDNFAAPDIQPNGISAKQIRIWFDNRRAKERLDYMRAKIKDVKLKVTDADELQKLKDRYILEAKDVLESRVSRLRETTQGAAMIIEEGSVFDGPALTTTIRPRSSPSTTPGTSGSGSSKKRLRIDYLASVRKAIKDARDAGKTEDEIKTVRNAAIEAARERLHIPTKSSRNSKIVGEEEINHVKCKFLQMLESNAPAEEVADMVELFNSLDIPRSVLFSCEILRILQLATKTYKKEKWLHKEIKNLETRFEKIMDGPETLQKRKEKRLRLKFTPMQLKALEKCYLRNNTPGKKMLVKITDRFNSSPLRDESQSIIDFKQIRCWFYKRRSANETPNSLQENNNSMNTNDTEINATEISTTESEDEDDDDDEIQSQSINSFNTPTQSSNAKDKDSKGGRIFSRRQIEFVRREYELDPRPDAKSVDTMCEILNTKPYEDLIKNPNGVTRRQIMTWFSNRRAKERHDFIKEKVIEAKSSGVTGKEEIDKIKEDADLEIKDLIDSRTKPRTDQRGKHQRLKKSKVTTPSNENTEESTESEKEASSDNELVDEIGDELESVESNYTQTDDDEENTEENSVQDDDDLSDSDDDEKSILKLKKRKLSTSDVESPLSKETVKKNRI